MDSLEAFLSHQAKEESELLESLESPKKSTFDAAVSQNDANQNSNDDDDVDTATTERTFADKLGLDAKEQQFDLVKSRQRFEATLQNTLHNCIVDRTGKRKSSKSEETDNSLRHRLESGTYKFKKKTILNEWGTPYESKIHKTPRPWQAGKFGKAWTTAAQRQSGFQPRDPRFMKEGASSRRDSGGAHQSGWQHRNAYTFLDDIIDRDIGMIQEGIKNTKEEIRNAKKQATTRNHRTELDIKRKDAAMRTLKEELYQLQNRKQRITEKDLEQKSKSEARKQELEQIRSGHKQPFHHNLQKTRFGQVKWDKSSSKDGEDESRIDIQKIYVQQKYDKLKNDGKLEKYMRKKTQRINTKARSALAKKSGAGWNESG